jgi:hypothetical protein
MVVPFVYRLCRQFGYFAGRAALSKDHDSRGYPLGGQISLANLMGNVVQKFLILLHRGKVLILQGD